MPRVRHQHRYCPCDDCAHVEHCARHETACVAFRAWAHGGTWDSEAETRLPRLRVYLDVMEGGGDD